MQTASYKISGVSPLFIHNGRLSDPLHEYAKALSYIAQNKKKSEDDHLRMSKIEWFGGMYHNGAPDEIIDHGKIIKVDPTARVIIPTTSLEAMISGAAAKKRLRKSMGSVLVEEDSILDYDGPTDINALYAEGKHIDRRAVVATGRRVQRTRPLFRRWSVTFTASFDKTQLDADTLTEIVILGGSLEGLGDWRPGSPKGGKFGRYEAVRLG
jgi:hypothetical protein